VLDKYVDKIVECTVGIFQKILKDTQYAPSSLKFFYQFNLRDLSKVCEGLMLATSNQYKGKAENFMRLFIHETKRAFEDRMINFDDINKFRGYFKGQVSLHLGDEFAHWVDVQANICTSFIS